MSESGTRLGAVVYHAFSLSGVMTQKALEMTEKIARKSMCLGSGIRSDPENLTNLLTEKETLGIDVKVEASLAKGIQTRYLESYVEETKELRSVAEIMDKIPSVEMLLHRLPQSMKPKILDEILDIMKVAMQSATFQYSVPDGSCYKEPFKTATNLGYPTDVLLRRSLAGVDLPTSLRNTLNSESINEQWEEERIKAEEIRYESKRRVVRDQAAHLKSIATKGVDIKVAGMRPLDKTEIQAIYTGNSADVLAKDPVATKPHKAKKNKTPGSSAQKNSGSSAQKNSATASMKTSVVRRDSTPTPLIITSGSASKKVGGRLGRCFDLEIRLKYKKACDTLGKPAGMGDSQSIKEPTTSTKNTRTRKRKVAYHEEWRYEPLIDGSEKTRCHGTYHGTGQTDT
ncbi:uncharacterized protein RAG0_02753 [Rhynchosporium agropyri]|uniref:Uncharacterized protein n=1 Tax=Rhynchosporium agropyri TaxID=914238 RepID=A0A1E1K2Q7_9HELO|nr:uncharacterized protein RAG0_02753 [Rhynchosporium agropyri]